MTPGGFGGAQARPPSRLFWTLGAVGLAGVAALYAADYAAERARDIGLTRAWTAAGPPCPTLSDADYAARRYPAHERRTEYDSVVMARQSGHVSCKEIADRWGLGFLRHPVCQFTSPGAVRVAAGATQVLFDPGPGRRATVSVERGKPRCAIGGAFTLFHDPT